VKKAQEGLGVALVRKERGGRTGGQTALTAEGQRWVRAYTRFRGDIEKTVARAYQKHFVELLK
jgi:molybdate transport repressor ModE-like protein